MKRLIFYFIILVAAVWIGLKMQADPGYVLISYRDIGIETTLWFALVALLVVFSLLYIVLRLLGGSRLLPRRLQRWLHARSQRKAIKLTNLGLIKLMEGADAVAEKRLLKAAKANPNHFINYLEAAHAAQDQAAYGRRDSYLNKAIQKLPKAELAVGIVQSRLQIKAEQWEQALATLKHLRVMKPKHNPILILLKDAYLGLHDWSSLKELLPILYKRKTMPVATLLVLEERVYLELLKGLINNKKVTYDEIVKFWEAMPRLLRKNTELVVAYVRYLLRNKLGAEAELLLRETLNKNWQDSLLELYAGVSSAYPSKQLSAAEHWLKTHSHDANLFLCLGRLCKQQALWGKARHYLEKSIKEKATTLAYLELGQVMEVQGEARSALGYYRKGLELTHDTNHE
jgi:HemY protein